MEVLNLLCEPNFCNYLRNKGNFFREWQQQPSDEIRQNILNAYKEALEKQSDFYKKPVEELRLFVLEGKFANYSSWVRELGRCKAQVEQFPALRQKMENAQGTLKLFAWSGIALGAGLLVFQTHHFRSFIRVADAARLADKAVSGGVIARFIIGLYLGIGATVGSGAFACQCFYTASQGHIDKIQNEQKLFGKINENIDVAVVNNWLGIGTQLY